jgi:hypothetical protein
MNNSLPSIRPALKNS